VLCSRLIDDALFRAAFWSTPARPALGPLRYTSTWL